MSKNITTELENTKKEQKTINKQCIRNDEELQAISVKLRELGYGIARLNANFLLMLPLKITYEDWCFLRMVADSDIDD